MRIFFSVGEPSGDLHASNLIRRLKSQQTDIECVGYGGPKMAAEGCDIHYDLTQMAVMFIWEALKKIRHFLKLAKQAETYFQNNQVDAVVLIDYAGFNWWIAKRAKRNGIPVFFYGVPQMWAWGSWRIKKIRKYVDHVLCKLPFEAEWFRQRDCKASYVGHPYFDELYSQEYDDEHLVGIKEDGTKLLTLLPGSRDQEVEKHLPILLNTAYLVQKEFEQVHIAVASYNQRQFERAQEIAADYPVSVSIYVDQTPELMRLADVCVACSGSVSLELLFHRKPTVIVYKLSHLFMFLQTFMLHIKFITLANLIGTSDIRKKGWKIYDPDAKNAEQCVMPEFLSTRDVSHRVAPYVLKWLKDERTTEEKIKRMDELAKDYALPGATGRAADYILNVLSPHTTHEGSSRNKSQAA